MVIQEEMMMKKYTLSILAIVILASACREEALEPEQQKGEIVLSAFTSYTQDELSTKGPGEEFFEVATKTAFSGKDENDNVVSVHSARERIDWQTGDKIYVNMIHGGASKGTAVYTVGGYRTATGNDKSISETTSLSSGTPLTSQESGEHVFLSTYPASGGDSPIGPVGSNGKFTLRMPEGNLGFTVTDAGSQRYVVCDNMEYAFMAGRTSSSNVSNVKLRLRPYFNAYQFIIGEAPHNYWLTEVRLTSSNYLRTKEDYTLTGGVNSSGTQTSLEGTINNTTCSKVITYNLKEGAGYSNGIPLWHTDGTIDLTLLALPLAQGDLSVQFTFKPMEGSGASFTKTLNITDKTLQPFHKLRVHDIGGAKWVYVLEVTDEVNTFPAAEENKTKTDQYKVKSYRYKQGRPGQAEAVKWATFINLGNRASGTEDWRWIGNNSQYGNPQSAVSQVGWMKFNNRTNGTGGADWETRTVEAQSHYTTVTSSDPSSFFKDAIANNVHRSGINNLTDSNKAIDLSLYDISGNPLANGRSTANCYVVSAPGWYKIPLVYGNMLKGDAKNDAAAVSGVHVDHNGNNIVRPWIRVQLGNPTFTPELVWQDSAPASCTHCGHEHGVIDIQTAFITSDKNFLVFHLPQHSIRPGNNVIGVKVGNDIAWSWHIWVTDQDLTPRDGRYMSALVGWIPLSLQGGTNLSKVFPNRSEQVKIVQVLDNGETRDPDGLEKEILFYQQGNIYNIIETNREYKFGQSVYFQYGRKDPMFPSYPTGHNNRTQDIYDSAGNLLSGSIAGTMPNTNGSAKSVQESIKNPATFYTTGTPFSAHVGNYWNPNNKTVYDPSPIGYRVIERFTGAFQSQYQESLHYIIVTGNVTYPGCYIGNNGKLFLPAVGQRGGGDSILMGTPANKDSFGEGANNSYSNLWAASGNKFIVNIGIVGSTYRGLVGTSSLDSDPWNTLGTATDGFPVLCVTE